jgi:hypothetical protein
MKGVSMTSIITLATLFMATVTVIYVFLGVKIHNISSAVKTDAKCKKFDTSEKIIEETDNQIKNLKRSVMSAGSCLVPDKFNR